ncbi:ATP-binding cassette domain-containing protein [Agrococcus beijingensis]|uniref:ATP-binding cassette domain-containing protein n=1 Tax=Agrococcus beijingensis TaxID=3068634 RepID=UPI002742720A|nr:ATP-binding cassette domain-containing protein [Agrococcus sp. REN33]
MRLTLDGLGHRFNGGPWLFRRLSAEIAGGSSIAVTGPSGSGKSTLLAILAGLFAPAEGTVEHDRSRRVIWVPQLPHGVPRRSVADHVLLPLSARGVAEDEADAEAERLLDAVGLADRAEARFDTISGGEAQRLMVARALATDPSLLLVDEPTAQLDRATAAIVNAMLRSLTAPDTVIVVATHDAATRDACDVVLDIAGRR